MKSTHRKGEEKYPRSQKLINFAWSPYNFEV
jgi:hypothetical protein